MNRAAFLALMPAAFLLLGNVQESESGALELTPQDGYFVADGTLVPETGDHVDRIRKNHRDIRVLVLKNVPGSDDENDYMDVALKLRDAGFVMIVPSDGVIASGGTDFFLAGQYRIIEPGACIGVHSWEEVGSPPLQGKDLPRDHEDHKEYLDFFADIGISADFYWFTLEEAPAQGMHWMSPEEINRFGMSSRPLPPSQETEEQRTQRCETRADAAEDDFEDEADLP